MFPNDEEKIAQAALKSFEVENRLRASEDGRFAVFYLFSSFNVLKRQQSTNLMALNKHPAFIQETNMENLLRLQNLQCRLNLLSVRKQKKSPQSDHTTIPVIFLMKNLYVPKTKSVTKCSLL
jgi:hypothetical protein